MKKKMASREHRASVSPKTALIGGGRRGVDDETRSQLALFHDARDVRDVRANGQMTELWMVAQSMILCGLPYDEVKETRWSRRARLADGSELVVTFSASLENVPLPFGQDRGPFYFMIDRALAKLRELKKEVAKDKSLSLTLSPELLKLPLEQQELELDRRRRERDRRLDSARFVEWATAAEYLEAMGKNKGGSDYVVLKERMRRIRGCSISVVRCKANGDDESLILPIIRSSRLPGWASESRLADSGASGGGEPMGFELGPDFFSDVVGYHVPFPAVVIKKLLRRPKILDLVTWISWRSYAAKTQTFIEMDELRRQFGGVDSNESRLARDLKQAIGFLREAGWNELNAAVVSKDRFGKRRAGLEIGPPDGNVQFTASGTFLKALAREGDSE